METLIDELGVSTFDYLRFLLSFFVAFVSFFGGEGGVVYLGFDVGYIES